VPPLGSGYENKSIQNQSLMISSLEKIEKLLEGQMEDNSKDSLLSVNKLIINGNRDTLSELKTQTDLLRTIADRLKGFSKKGPVRTQLGKGKDMIMQTAGILIALGGAFYIFGNGLLSFQKVNQQEALTFGAIMITIFSSISLIFRKGIILSIKQAIKLQIVSVIVAMTIDMVSQILSRVRVLSPQQIGSALGTAALMVGITFAITKVIGTIFSGGGGIMGLIMGVVQAAATGMALTGALVIMPLMAMAIVISNNILNGVDPVDQKKLASVFMTGIALLPMAYIFLKITNVLTGPSGMDKLMNDASDFIFKTSGMSRGKAALGALGLIPLLALAAVTSSSIMNALPPPKYSAAGLVMVGLLGLALIPFSISFAMVTQVLRYMVSGKGIFKAMMMGVIAIPLIALTMILVSKIFAKQKLSFGVIDIVGATLAGFALTAFAIPFTIVAFGMYKLLQKIKNPATFLLISGLLLPSLAMTIVLTAHIFKLLPPSYMAPSVKWVLKAGFAMTVFGIPFVAMTILFKALKAKDLIKGTFGMVLLAGTIVAVSTIFSIGLPTKEIAPGIGWSLEAGLAMAIFSVPFIAMTILFKPFNEKDVLMGSFAMLVLSGTIVGVSYIFDMLPENMKYPSLKWTISTAAAMFAFGIPFMLFTVLLGKFFGKGSFAKLIGYMVGGALAMSVLALTIVGIAWIFQLLPDTFKIIPYDFSMGIALLAIPMLFLGATLIALGFLTAATGGVGLLLGAAAILIVMGVIVALSYMVTWMEPSFFKKDGVFYDIADTLAYFGMKIIDVFIYLVDKGMPYIMKFIKFAINTILPVMPFIAKTIANFVVMLEPPINRLLTGILPLFKVALDGFVEILGMVRDIVVAILNNMADVIKEIGKAFRMGLQSIESFITRMDKIGGARLLALGGALTAVAVGIGAIALATAGASVAGGLSSIFGSVVEFITGKKAFDAAQVIDKLTIAIRKFTSYQSSMGKMAASFKSISESMKVIKGNINAINPVNLKSTENLFKTIDTLTEKAKDDDNVVNKIGKAVESGISTAISWAADKLGMGTKQEQPKTAPVVQNEKGNNLQMAQMQQALIQNNLLMTQMLAVMSQMNAKLGDELQVRVHENPFQVGRK
jgi:hypothetical protein